MRKLFVRSSAAIVGACAALRLQFRPGRCPLDGKPGGSQ